MIHFEEVDPNNLDAIINLELTKDQQGFMEDNLYSMAQAAVYSHYRTRGIYAGSELLGFLLYYFVEDEPDYVYLHRFMIDKNEQGKGYGRQAVKEALKLFKEEFPSIKCVELMHYPDNQTAAALYQSLNFKKTGELRASEPCRIEEGTTDPNRYREIVRRYYY